MQHNELDLLLRGLESLRAHLGAEWVDREVDAALTFRQSDTTGGRGHRRRFHPAADLFARVRHHIDQSPTPISPTRDLIRLGILGQQISLLKQAGVTGISEKITSLRSDNWGLFASTTFEIEAAALHVQIGRHAKFVPEGPQRTPDLLVDNEVEIECKSLSQLTQRDENNREMWSQLRRKIWAATRGGSGYYVQFETTNDVRQEDIAWVLEHLEIARQRPDLEAQEANRSLRIAQLDPVRSTSKSGIECTPPPGAPPLEEFDVGTVEMTMKVEGGLVVQPHSTYMFAFRTKTRPDWETRAHSALKQARKQISGTAPAIVFIEAPLGNKDTNGRIGRGIADAIKELFRQSRSVSAVVACFANVEPVGAGEGLTRSYCVERNPRARIPIPPPEIYFAKR